MQVLEREHTFYIRCSSNIDGHRTKKNIVAKSAKQTASLAGDRTNRTLSLIFKEWGAGEEEPQRGGLITLLAMLRVELAAWSPSGAVLVQLN